MSSPRFEVVLFSRTVFRPCEGISGLLIRPLFPVRFQFHMPRSLSRLTTEGSGALIDVLAAGLFTR